MAMLIPSIRTLIDRISGDIKSSLPEVDSNRRYGVIATLRRVFAGLVYGLYGYIDHKAKQFFADTCDDSELDRHASLWLEDGRKAASKATGSAIFSGNVGAPIALGSQAQTSEGVQVETTADAVIGGGGTVTIAVSAVVPGQAGNLAGSTAMTLVSPIASIQSTVTVSSAGLSGGTDIESNDELRARILDRMHNPPEAGTPNDYIRWAKQVAGVTRAWVQKNAFGSASAAVYFVRDNDTSIIPDTNEVAAVQAYLDSKLSVCSDVTVLAPVGIPRNFTIQLVPDNASIRAAVTASLTDLIKREGYPGATLRITHIHEAISIASGEVDHILTVPAADVTHAAGQMPLMGTITWA